MARLLVCVIVLLFAASAYGRDESSISPSPVSSNSSTSGPAPTSSRTTPLPTSSPTALNYTVNNSSNKPCVKMSGAIQIRVAYNVSGAPSRLIPVSVVDTVNASAVCKSDSVNFTLEGFYPAEIFLYNISFIMNKYGGNEWNVSDVQVLVNLNNSDLFKNNSKAHPNSKSTLLGEQPNPGVFSPTLDDTQSYSCNSSTNYTMTVKNGAADTYHLNLTLSEFKLQAVQFLPATASTEDFANAQKCPADIKGSKIVPIAVGIALAGLVIIVIVAYIVGRLRSRKQNSYEALS